MHNFSFEHPVILSMMLLLPLVILFLESRKDRGGVVDFSFAIWKDNVPKTWDIKVRRFLFLGRLLFWIGLLLLVIAAADPVNLLHKKVYLTRGAEIMIVLDESPSMSAKDFQPVNRFQSAKLVIKKFISGRENDRIGLVAFSRRAALIVPPTIEYESLYQRLDSLKVMELGNGTAIGSGIVVAINHLRESDAKTKIIVLITDGDNNAGEILPQTAADMARELGVRIYTIGIGKDIETYIEFHDPKTGKLYQGLYKGKLGTALLKNIAERSGGEYFYAGDKESLSGVFERIDSLEKVERIVSFKTAKENKRNPLIILGLILIVTDLFLRKFIFKEILG